MMRRARLYHWWHTSRIKLPSKALTCFYTFFVSSFFVPAAGVYHIIVHRRNKNASRFVWRWRQTQLNTQPQHNASSKQNIWRGIADWYCCKAWTIVVRLQLRRCLLVYRCLVVYQFTMQHATTLRLLYIYCSCVALYRRCYWWFGVIGYSVGPDCVMLSLALFLRLLSAIRVINYMVFWKYWGETIV